MSFSFNSSCGSVFTSGPFSSPLHTAILLIKPDTSGLFCPVEVKYFVFRWYCSFGQNIDKECLIISSQKQWNESSVDTPGVG